MSAAAIDLPLTRWYCDECRQPITDINLGTISWNDPTVTNPSRDHLEHEFPAKIFILHKGDCDDNRKRPQSYDLNFILSTEGMQVWAGFLWNGPIAEPMVFVPGVDVKPVMELFFRLFVPYYEQARRLFKTENADEFLDGRTIFSESELKRFIEESGS